jgi:hypothetical protein
METATNTATFLRSLKGAPLSVLIAIRILPGPASLIQLAALTGYEKHTCARATEALEAMGYISRAHYRGWRLTAGALQLPLWTPGELDEEEEQIESGEALALEAGDEGRGLKRAKSTFQAQPTDEQEAAPDLKRAKSTFQPDEPTIADTPGERADELKRHAPIGAHAPFQPEQRVDEEDDAEKLKRAKCAFQPDEDSAVEPKREKCALQPPLDAELPSRAPSGGSSLINPLTRELKPPPLPHSAGEPKRAKTTFQPDEEELLADLVDLTGCPRHRAEQAVGAARAEGYFTPWLHLQVLHWHAYLADGRGKNLQNPGYFVARKLEDGEACPFEDVRNGHIGLARELRYRLEDAQRAAEASPEVTAA